MPQWWFKKELTGGGALIDVGCHLTNLLRWYFGELKDVKSHLEHRFNLDLEDHVICLIKFESGTVAVMTVGWFSQEFQVKVDLFGTVRHSEAQMTSENPLLTASQLLTTGLSKFFWPYLAELQHFVHCLTQDLILSPSGKDALKDLEAIVQAYDNQVRLE